MKTITPQELAARHQRGEPIELIDVRTPAEFQALHCAFARNIPLGDLDPQALNRTATLYLICKSGGRGRQACQKLHAAGHQVVNVEGGTEAWAAAGLPVVRGQQTMSLERQVRIAAGSLVVLGVTLAYAVHPWFIGLSAFIGAGLVFAGVTDTCGMGMLLARMPWNQAPPACSTPAVKGAQS